MAIYLLLQPHLDITFNTVQKLKRHYHQNGTCQSMSCRGVYWSYAHFGHFKEEVNIKEYEKLEEVRQEIKEFKKLLPVRYRQQLPSLFEIVF